MVNKIEFFGKQRLTSLLNKLSEKFKKTDKKIDDLLKTNTFASGSGHALQLDPVALNKGAYRTIILLQSDVLTIILRLTCSSNEKKVSVIFSTVEEKVINNYFSIKLDESTNIVYLVYKTSFGIIINGPGKTVSVSSIPESAIDIDIKMGYARNIDKSKINTSNYATVSAGTYLRIPVTNICIIDIIRGSNSFQLSIIGRLGTDKNYCKILKYTDKQGLDQLFDFYYDPNTGDRYVQVKMAFSYTSQGYLEQVSLIPETVYRIDPVIETIQNINDLSFPSKIVTFTMNDVIKFPYRNLTDGGFVTLMMTNGRNVDFFNFSTVPGSNQILRHMFSSNLNFKHGIFKRDLDNTMYYIPSESSYVYAAGAFEIVNSSNVPETAVEVSPTVLNIQNVPSSAQLTNVELALAEMYEQNLKEES